MAPTVQPGRPRASLLVWRADDGSGDTPGDILNRVIERLRAENAIDGAREISVALQRCEEGLLWLDKLERKRRESQHGLSNGT